METLIAFELEYMKVLEYWDGDLSKMDGSSKFLEQLFAAIDKEKD